MRIPLIRIRIPNTSTNHVADADPDPNPEDPYDFGPPRSGSISESYGSGSIHH
jgi:hypothetical protein